MKIIKAMILQRISKATAQDDLDKLLAEILDGAAIPDAQLKTRLSAIFSRPKTLAQDEPAYAEILRLTSAAYEPGRQITPLQRQALAETLYQKALNLFHLSDYRQRGTAKVQVRAILDSRTTPQCRQMNGRIFSLEKLSREAPNQAALVRSNDWWESAAYFRGVPTQEMIPSLPPYHYNCRTRIVPYLYADEYDNFNILSSSHPLYPSLLKDRLQNYDLDVSHLPTIIERALSSKWKPGKLDLHYAKHNPDFAFIFPSARLYSKAAKALIEDETAIKCLRLEEDRLILLVFLQDPESRKKAWYYVVCDLEKGVIRSFYKKKNKAIQKILKDLDIKQMLFTPSVGATGGSPALDLIKKESLMLQSDIDQALGELEELHTIDSYEDVIRMVKTKDEDDVLTYAEDLFSDRSDNLFILINAGLLSPDQLARIKKVDAWLLSHPVPYQLQPLKDWLTKHQVEALS